MQTADLARSNIQRPYMRFDMKRASGRHPLEIKSVAKSYDDLKVIPRFTASVARGEKIALIGPQRRGQNHAAEIADSQRDWIHRGCGPAISDRRRHGDLGTRSGRRLLCAGPHRLDPPKASR